MQPTAPHYLLFTEAKDNSESSTTGGRWRFVLEQIGTPIRIEEADDEPGVRGERLQLLAVVRGLEALEQRSNVTLITSSKYVGRGIRHGLNQWRHNHWQWEHFGQMTLIKNHDLWIRIDQAMQIHQITCRIWQFEAPHVRTQVAQESDQAVLIGCSQPDSSPEFSASIQSSGHKTVKEKSPLRSLKVQPIRDEEEISESLGRGNHLRLNFEKRRREHQQRRQFTGANASLLANKVKPIGQGKAFGYAL